jgi:hypothetical protein
MYRVIRDFTDLQDNRRLYEKGQTYPREGYSPSEDRLKELSSKNNKNGKVYIKKVDESAADEENYPIHKGGGNYLLSDGRKVKGKDKAFKEEEKLKSGE